jgi:hypothetical protein
VWRQHALAACCTDIHVAKTPKPVMFFGKSLEPTFSSRQKTAGSTLFLKKKQVYHPEPVNKMSLQLPVENMSVCK